ncbi:MAG: leucyl aminopeptidase [Saprospiraceae bacterium]
MTIQFKTDFKQAPDHLIFPMAKEKDLRSSFQQLETMTGITAKSLTTDFKAAKSEIVTLYYKVGTKDKKISLLGLGEKPTYQSVKDSFRALSHRNKENGAYHVYCMQQQTQELCEQYCTAAVNGLWLGTYQIGLYKTQKTAVHSLAKTSGKIVFYVNKSAVKTIKPACQKALALAQTQASILDLVNGAGNRVKPSTLGNWAKASGKQHGYKVKVLNKKQITQLGLGALLAVNRGSEYPPSFTIMEYQPKKKQGQELPTIGLVGKGVTFDTGGLSIKGHLNMHFMKSDMGGAAAVLGTMEMAAKLQLPIHLVGIVPSTDNCVDATAIKPGDIINSYSGKTIEVIDTDAEGRLILADGLAYLNKIFKPGIMIDVATLTGSCVRTLGYQAGGLFTKNDHLADQLLQAGQQSGERLWRLPMWDDYKKDIASDVADVKNFSGRPVAGAISAAKFLEAFTAEHPSWVHLDIAGVAFGHSAYSQQRSATGFGVHLLTEFLEKL